MRPPERVDHPGDDDGGRLALHRDDVGRAVVEREEFGGRQPDPEELGRVLDRDRQARGARDGGEEGDEVRARGRRARRLEDHPGSARLFGVARGVGHVGHVAVGDGDGDRQAPRRLGHDPVHHLTAFGERELEDFRAEAEDRDPVRARGDGCGDLAREGLATQRAIRAVKGVKHRIGAADRHHPPGP